ncbi:MAG: hypothetical protein ABSE51_13910 [Terracidiphilus sp.]|jgi:hypothetical protein
MTDNQKILTCQQFQAQLPELIGSGENLAENPHLEHCALCRELLADLETIAEAARNLLPVEEPPDELWKQIEYAIENEKGELQPREVSE